METPNKSNNAAVDNILEELKKKNAGTASSEGSLDDILAEMKGGTGKAAAPARPVASQPAAPPPAAPRQPAAAQAAKPTPPAQPSAGGTAVFKAVGGEKPARPAGASRPGRDDATAIFSLTKDTGDEASRRDATGATRTLPAFEIGEETGPVGPRLGKAAAIDRVDHDKFAGDEELLSWFSAETDSKFSRRAMRKAEKERKKQQAADEKERKRREKHGEGEPEELWADYPIEPLVREKPAGAPAADAPADTGESPEETFARGHRHLQEAPPVDMPVAKTPQAAVAAPPAAPPTVPVGGGRKKGSVTAVLEELGMESGARPSTAGSPQPAPAARVSQAAPPPRPAVPGRQKGPVTAVLEELGVESPAGPRPQAAGAAVSPAQPAAAAPPVAPPTVPQGGIKKKGPVTAVLEELGLERDAQGRAVPAQPKSAPAARPPRPPAPVAPSQDTGDDFLETAEGSTIEINVARVAELRRQSAAAAPRKEKEDTQTFAPGDEHDAVRVPTAAYTQEFPEADEADSARPDAQRPKAESGKNLFLDDMVDERFQDFFSSTVIVDRDELEQPLKGKLRRKPKKSHTALITGEFARLAEQAEAEEDEEFEDYNRPQDAEAVEKDIVTLRTNLTRRTIISAVLGGLLVWLGLGFGGILPLPAFLQPAEAPLLFAIVYLALLVAAVVLNFTTVATGLVGLVGEPTVDSPPALAAVAALLQGVVLAVQLGTGQPAVGTLFAGIAVLVLTFNCLGKRLRATAILENFRVASAGLDHSAAYVLDGGHEVAYNISGGLEEENPSILLSRPTALVKGFLRQSFSQRWSDRLGRILGWVILAVAAALGVFSYVQSSDLMQAISALAAVFCLAAPFSSTLLAAVPSLLLQMGTTKVGAVVPGWSAIEELGGVNVVMAGAQDIFPPGSVHLRGIKTFEKERVDLAILYAASVLVESCPTLHEVFLAVIQGKSEMLFKVENLLEEPGRGFSAWVENNRVVIGTREMLQKHGIDPPAVELEMKFTQGGYLPVYLAVSGRLFAMFIIGYTPDTEVQDTLDGLIKSGVSLLVKSEDMNVTNELIERVYQLPGGVVKVLGKKELDLLEPLQAYLPESEGVMTHMGSFASFIGGMRAAAGCAAAERMSGIVQAASVGLACVIAFLLVYSGSLATLAMGIAILYQLGWSVLVSALPFARRY